MESLARRRTHHAAEHRRAGFAARQVVSDVVLKNFSQSTSCILRQPALVDFLRGKLDKLSARTKDTALMKAVDAGLADMAKTVSFPLGETAPKDDVQKLHEQAAKLLELIGAK